MLKKLAEFRAQQQYQNEDAAFLSDVNTANLYGASWRSHLILWLAFLFIIIALIWAHFAELDEVTRGSGKTIPSSQIQVIQNLEGGIISEILVKEGDLVQKGQVLLKLDALRFASSYNETKLKYYELQATTARLNAEIEQKDLSSTIESLYRIEVICKDEEHQENIYNKLIEQGYECRLLTL